MVNHKFSTFVAMIPRMLATELDYIEEKGRKLRGFEFKWKPKNKRAPRSWLETYQNSSFSQIHTENFPDFLL